MTWARAGLIISLLGALAPCLGGTCPDFASFCETEIPSETCAPISSALRFGNYVDGREPMVLGNGGKPELTLQLPPQAKLFSLLLRLENRTKSGRQKQSDTWGVAGKNGCCRDMVSSWWRVPGPLWARNRNTAACFPSREWILRLHGKRRLQRITHKPPLSGALELKAGVSSGAQAASLCTPLSGAAGFFSSQLRVPLIVCVRCWLQRLSSFIHSRRPWLTYELQHVTLLLPAPWLMALGSVLLFPSSQSLWGYPSNWAVSRQLEPHQNGHINLRSSGL